MPLLELKGVAAGYGRVQVLRDLTFAVPEGSVVALVGPNGVGKTTTLRVISGTLPIRSGEVRFDGRRIDGLGPYRTAERGITLVPEGRGVFPGLTVADNLSIAAHADRSRSSRERDAALEETFSLFPRLRERADQLAGTMSGGEQQMLALSRAFLAQPRLLLVDELSMGLAPQIVADLFASLERFRQRGVTIVLVEQFLTYALAMADICYEMAKGSIVFAGDPAEVEAGHGVQHFGVA